MTPISRVTLSAAARASLTSRSAVSLERLKEVSKIRSEVLRIPYEDPVYSGPYVSLAAAASTATSSSSIFGTSPVIRDGSKYLRAPLRGQEVLNYYPRKYIKTRDMQALFPDREIVDAREEHRLAKIQADKKRGKGAPKKGQGKQARLKKK